MVSKVICRNVDYRRFQDKNLIIEMKYDLQGFLSNDSEYNEDVSDGIFRKILYDWSIFPFGNDFAMENGFWKWPNICFLQKITNLPFETCTAPLQFVQVPLPGFISSSDIIRFHLLPRQCCSRSITAKRKITISKSM